MARAGKSKRLVFGSAARRKHGAQHARISAEARGCRKFVLVVRGDSNDAAATRARQQAMGPVHAISADARRQVFISSNQQSEIARTRDTAECARYLDAVLRAEMPVNNGCPARQAAGDRARIRRAGWIGKEKQRRNGRLARLAVEPRRLRR